MNPKKSRQQTFLANYGKLLPADKTARILEIGPGAGETCELLGQELGYSGYVGVDVTDSYHRTSSDFVKSKVVVVADSSEHLQRHTAQFDLAIMLHVLEHIPKARQPALLSAIRAALRPGGVLIVEVPNIANMFLGPYFRYSDLTHEIGFTDCSLQCALQGGGFNPADIEVRPVRVPLVSVSRVIQAALQGLLNGLQRLLMFPYIPSGRVITSMYLNAVARRQD